MRNGVLRSGKGSPVGWASAHHWQRKRFVFEQTRSAASATLYIDASTGRVARRALPRAAA